MSKYEFLAKLRDTLSEELSSQEVEEQMEYYNQYITDAVMSGRTEAEVLEELGDPWVIARTLIDAGTEKKKEEYIYDYSGKPYENQEASHKKQSYDRKVKIYRLDSWWQKALIVLVVLGILFLLLSFVTGIVSLLAPVLIPLILLVLLMKMFRKR